MEHHAQKNRTKKQYSKKAVCFFGIVDFLLRIMSDWMWSLNCAQRMVVSGRFNAVYHVLAAGTVNLAVNLI